MDKGGIGGRRGTFSYRYLRGEGGRYGAVKRRGNRWRVQGWKKRGSTVVVIVVVAAGGTLPQIPPLSLSLTTIYNLNYYSNQLPLL